jgi:hypothetical protein
MGSVLTAAPVSVVRALRFAPHGGPLRTRPPSVLPISNEQRDVTPSPVTPSHLAHGPKIAAGIATFEIARMAGTSVLQIEKTYGHLLPDAI